jgi:L-aspartate oxidase
VQFHPTALAVPGSFLVSEAVRGDGAVLRNAEGERFMESVHPLADLAPRDVVARAIAVEMQRTGAPVYLDATSIGADELERRFPTISRACRANGFDWSREPVPVAPAAHYWMGGIATDLDGRTSLPGFYAVGEVACTGLHGANRLASNSLLESIVFAHRCAAAIVRGTAPVTATGAAGADRGTRMTVAPAGRADATNPRLGLSEPTRHELRQLMQRTAGVHRSADGLREAREMLAGWHRAAPDAVSATVEQLETANLLQLARLVVQSALVREESRGAHSRADHPHTDPAYAGHLAVDRAQPRPRLVPTIETLVQARAASLALEEQVAV